MHLQPLKYVLQFQRDHPNIKKRVSRKRALAINEQQYQFIEKDEGLNHTFPYRMDV